MVARAPGRRRDGLQLNNGMSHPWLAPPPALIADVVCAAARDAVRAMSLIPARALGLVVLGRGGRMAIDAFAVAPLPVIAGAVLVDDALRPPDSSIGDQVRRTADLAGSSLPAGWLERITIGSGEGVPREARLG